MMARSAFQVRLFRDFAAAATRRFKPMAIRSRRAACTVLLVILTSCAWCQSADVVLVRADGRSSTEQQELELATRFYGLSFQVVTLSANITELSKALEQNANRAVAIEANA